MQGKSQWASNWEAGFVVFDEGHRATVQAWDSVS
jgi:hypothetical protein